MTGTQPAATDPAAFPAGPMTETAFRALYERLRHQVPWGPDDRRGALNYITPADVLAALGEPALAAPCHWPPRWSTGRPPTTPTPLSIR
ncbi:MAG TPA: hypothetical protein VFV73_31005 [Streptosporangiaceae bacterium]|nr:hypothetical protein [Streptosporangiaceae bacterium]